MLELATFPNLFLTCLQQWQDFSLQGEIDVTPETLGLFADKLRADNISISALSGHWSPQFADLVHKASEFEGKTNTIVLASETIYSPDTIERFTATLMKIMSDAQRAGGNATAYVAAKAVYFGVGGGMDEFKTNLRQKGGQAQVMWQSEGLGVKRLILKIERLE